MALQSAREGSMGGGRAYAVPRPPVRRAWVTLAVAMALTAGASHTSAASAFNAETLTLDSRTPASDGQGTEVVSTIQPLAQDQTYTATVSGTVSYYGALTWTPLRYWVV